MTAKIKAGSARARLAEAMHHIFSTPQGKILREGLRAAIEADIVLDEDGSLATSEGLWRKAGYRQFAIQLVAAGEVDIHHIEGRQEEGSGRSSE